MPRKQIAPPNLSDPPEEKADWTEWWTLINQDGNTSFAELRSVLKVPGSSDAAVEPEEFDYAEIEGGKIADRAQDYRDPYEAAAEATFLEISDRLFSCGDSSYPFNITSERIEIRADTIDSVYIFLLLLSKYGKDAGPKRNEGAKLFEDVCAFALMSFLGKKENYADAQVFGFPRRISCKDFPAALNNLCKRLGEGKGARKRPTSKDQKDAKLDVVGWKSFRDKKEGRIIIFGQCATGADWKDKRNELPPTHDWCSFWMKDRPAVNPIRSFFVPHRTGHNDWFQTNFFGGLLFDRCRIASLAHELPPNIADDTKTWSRFVINKNRVHK